MKRFLILTLICALLAATGFAAQTLELGASGETVMVLTRKLCELGYIDAPQSDFDARVASAVRDFQTANALSPTGVADTETQQLLYTGDALSRQAYILAFSKRHAAITFKPGDEGDEVKRLQEALKLLGYYLGEADSKYGEGTRRAVEEYQRANGLNPTGRADVSTRIRLYEGVSISRADYVISQCAAKGDAGSNVKSIQGKLSELGYFSGDLTGVYGDITQKAVLSFQALNSLPQTGDVDVVTYEALFSTSAISADESALRPGDSGDDVFSLQTRLYELGLFTAAPNGSYDRDTETAVMLFCVANEIEISPVASSEILAAINSETARGAESLDSPGAAVKRTALDAACQQANAMTGENFAQRADELFPGFDFVRYALASAGIAVLDPGEIIGGVGERAYSASDVMPGDIVMLGEGSGSALTRTFALCVGGGMLLYIEGNVVAASHMEDMEYTSAYLWRFLTDE